MLMVYDKNNCEKEHLEIMLTNTQADLKQLILTSWKDRWSEKKWSMHTRRYLHHASDVFHIADALVSQAFIGTSPNALLVSYIWYAFNTGLLSYASVITAISKHEDLHKIDSTRGVYDLLQKCLSIINESSLVEDSMDLCCSLRMVLQWLLRNTEQYLKGVHDVYANIAEELIKLNCQTLEQLTTKSRTSALLTIARFEESGAWSHIETDLAVIKSSSGQHLLHTEISESCHHVSQLSRCTISPHAIYPLKSSNLICISVSGFLLLEVKLRKFSDSEGIARQLMLLSQIHGLSMPALLFHVIQTCLIGFLDALECTDGMDQEWSAMLFLRMPKIFNEMKSLMRGGEFESPTSSASKMSAQFENNLCQALNKLTQLDSLLDTLDQLRDGMNWLQSLIELFIQHRLISDKTDLQEMRSKRENVAQYGQEKCKNPLLIIKTENTVEQLISAMGSGDFVSDMERLLKTFQGMCTVGSFSTLMASAAATGQLSSFASKLMHFNDSMKSRTAENNKMAQARAILFDISFLMVCHMIRLFGKGVVLGSHMHRPPEGALFIYQWLNLWWTSDTNLVNSMKYETDSSRVENLIQVLRTSSEFKLSLTKWHDICTNLPQSVLELVNAKHKGFVAFADLKRTCCFIRDGCPLTVNLAVCAALSRNARLTSGHADYKKMLEILIEKSQAQTQALPLYEDRYEYFKGAVGHMAGDLLPSSVSTSKKCAMSSNTTGVAILKDALKETRNTGWINHERLEMFLCTYKQLGIAAFTRQLASLILQDARLDAVETAVDITFTVMRLDMESFVIYMMKSGMPQHFMSEPHSLVAPVGPCLAKLLVACLDIALNDSLLKQKSLLTTSSKLSPFLYEASPDKSQDNTIKVRRLLSCSTEHDLSSSGSNLPSNEPLIVVLADFINLLWQFMNSREPGPLSEFVFLFVKFALYSTPLLSRTVKQLMPAPLAKELSAKLIQDSRELLFAATDLGNPEIRRISAQAICLAKNVT